MSLRRLAAALVVGTMLGACSVPTEESTVGLVNSCSSDSDCAGEAVCAELTTGAACVAVEADLSNIVFEVRTIGSSSGSTISRVLDEGFLVAQTKPDGVVVDHDLLLPPLVELSGRVLVGESDDRCAAADGTLPARIEARPVSVPVGDSVSATAFQYRTRIPL